MSFKQTWTLKENRQLFNHISIECNIFFSSFYELLIYDFLGTENYKGISRKIIILLFYRVCQFFTLAQVGTEQIYYFKEFINLPSINLKSFSSTLFSI